MGKPDFSAPRENLGFYASTAHEILSMITIRQNSGEKLAFVRARVGYVEEEKMGASSAPWRGIAGSPSLPCIPSQ